MSLLRKSTSRSSDRIFIQEDGHIRDTLDIIHAIDGDGNKKLAVIHVERSVARHAISAPISRKSRHEVRDHRLVSRASEHLDDQPAEVRHKLAR